MKIRNPFLVIVWSFGLFILMQTWQYLGALSASFISGATFESIISGKFENQNTIFVRGFVAVIVGIPMVYGITKYLWRRNFEWMRLHFNLKYFLNGIILGLIIPIIIIFILIALGNASLTELPIRFSAQELIAILIGYLGLTLYTAIAEEVVFRSMVVREIAAKWNWVIATLLGGIYFGITHLLAMLNDITVLGVLWITLAAMIASFLFVAMYIRSKSLWLPIGFHLGWNFCLKAVIGTKMSGKESNFGAFNFDLTGNFLITGGQFGVEASVITLFFSLVIAIIIIKYARSGNVSLLKSKPD